MLVALRSSSFRALSDLLLLCKKRPPKVGGVLAGGLSYVGNRYPSLQVALQNRFGQIFCIRLCSNTLAATLSSSFYERHPDAIAFGQQLRDRKAFRFVPAFPSSSVRCRTMRGFPRQSSTDSADLLGLVSFFGDQIPNLRESFQSNFARSVDEFLTLRS